MLEQIFLGFTGLCSGFIIAGGLTGLMIGLSIIPRYAGITHTADHILLYEDITFWGTELGNLFFLFHWNIRFGTPFLILYGALFRDFPWWMDHGPGRDGRYFPYLCQKKQIPERSFFYNPVHSRRQNCRGTDLLL